MFPLLYHQNLRKNLFCLKSALRERVVRRLERKQLGGVQDFLVLIPYQGTFLFVSCMEPVDLQVEIGPIRFFWAANIAHCPGGGWLCIHGSHRRTFLVSFCNFCGRLWVTVLVCKMERTYLTQIDTAFQLNRIFLGFRFLRKWICWQSLCVLQSHWGRSRSLRVSCETVHFALFLGNFSQWFRVAC